MKQALLGAFPSVGGNNITQFTPPWHGNAAVSTTEATGTNKLVIAAAGTLKNFYVQLTNAPGSGKSYTCTVRVNGSDTSLVVTISDAATSGNSGANTASVSAGDIVSLKIVPAGTPTATTGSTGMEFDPTDTTSCVAGGSVNAGFSASVQDYIAAWSGRPQSDAIETSIDFAAESICPIAGTVNALYVALQRAPAAGKQYDFYLYLNGSQQASSKVTISGTNLVGNVTGLSIAVAAGDTLAFSAVPTGTPTTPLATTWQFAITPTTAGEFPICQNSTSGGSSAASARFMHPMKSSTQVATEDTPVEGVIPFNFTLKKLRISTDTQPGTAASGKSYTAHSRINTADGNLSAQIFENTTSGSDLSNSDAVTAAQTFSWRYVPASTPATGAVKYGAVGIASSFSASATSTLPKLTSSAVGTMQPKAAATSSMPKLTSAGVAKETQAATATSTLPKLTSAGVAVDTIGLLVTGASTVPKLTSAGVVVMEPKAAAASTLPKLTALGAVAEPPRATAASRLPMLTSLGAAIDATPSFDETTRFGYIVDRPQVMYDGTGLVNRLIPFGVDSDGSDLTIEHANPSYLPYPILNDGDVWYIEDTDSIARYGLYELRVYRTDIKNPYRTFATGSLTLAVNPTNGDTFAVNGQTYTFVSSLTGAAGEILIGADVNATRQNAANALNGKDLVNAPSLTRPALVNVSSVTDDFTGLVVGAVYQPYDANGQVLDPRFYDPTTGLYDSAAAQKAADALKAIAYGSAGNSITTTGSFADPANGFADPTLVGGYDAVQTANTLYVTAVNMLLRQRSEVFAMRVHVANGKDIWALPGDRMRVRFRGEADTFEAMQQNGSSRVVWLDIDEWLLVTERTDSSDESGVRQVEFVLAAPVMQYPIPPLPEWSDPIALPVPGNTENYPPSGGPGFGGGIGDPGGGIDPGTDPPGAPWLTDTLGDLITRNHLPTEQCCPDPTTDITSGGSLPPGGDELYWVLASTGPTFNFTDTPEEAPMPDDTHVVLVCAFVGEGAALPTLISSDITATEIGSYSHLAAGNTAQIEWEDFYRFWVLQKSGDSPSWSVADAVIIPGIAVANRTIPAPITIEHDEQDVEEDQVVPFSVSESVSATVTSVDDADAIFAFVGCSETGGFTGGETLSLTFNGATETGIFYPLRTNIGATLMPAAATRNPADGFPTSSTDHLYLLLKAIRLHLNDA